MNSLSELGVLLGGSWASGINLYLTAAGLGIADRMGAISLPGDMQILSNPLIIGVAVILYGVEFVADKIPYVDSAWDSVHTVIRPLGGGVMAYMAMAGTSPAIQVPAALACSMVTMDAHLTKATTRAAINTSPEPFTNSAASISEDGLVAVLLWLIVKHPVIASVTALVLIVASFWLLKILFKFLKKILNFIFKGKEDKGEEKPV